MQDRLPRDDRLQADRSLRRSRARISRSRGKERFFFIRRVTFSASSEVLKRSLDRIAFLTERPCLAPDSTTTTKNAEEAFDTPVAVLEHANRIIKTTVGLCTNLNRHCFPSIPSVLMIVVHSARFGLSCALEDMKSGCCFQLRAVAHSPSEYRSSTALPRADCRSKRVREPAIRHKSP